MRRIESFAAKVAGALLVTLFIGSCSDVVLKGYIGEDIAPEKTSFVESGAGTMILAYDGEKVSRPGSRLALLPGVHTLEIQFSGVTNNFYWDSGNYHLFLEFDAEEGHTYLVSGELLSHAMWTAHIRDKKTRKKINARPVVPPWAFSSLDAVLRRGEESGTLFPNVIWGAERSREAGAVKQCTLGNYVPEVAPEARRVSLVPRPDIVIDKTERTNANIDIHAKDQTEKPRDFYNELIKLDDLKKRGIITDAEFEAQKRKLLGGD